MKFRCQVGKEGLAAIAGVAHTLGKISDNNTATVVMSEDFFRFSVISAQDATHPRCYAELSVQAVFLDYRIESQSANNIIFQVSLSLLTKALSSGKQAQVSELKLVKRDQRPFLSFESSAQANVAAVEVCHDIPIQLIHISEMQWLSPPIVPPPKIALELPSGKSFKGLLDKFVKLSRTVVLHAQQVGRIGLDLDETSAGVQVRCFVNHLRPLPLRFAGHGEEPADTNLQGAASVRVVIRHLSMALDHPSLPVYQVLLFLAGRMEAVVVHIKLVPETFGTMTFYLPALAMEEDQEEAPATPTGAQSPSSSPHDEDD